MAEQVRAWAPQAPLVREVFHATMTSHAYPAHTHDTWTVLLIDEGCVAYDLDRHARTAPERHVSLLPPHVTHDGRSASPGDGFRKRVLYLDAGWLPESMTGHAVDRPVLPGATARALTGELHDVLARPEDTWQAESLLLGLRDVVLGSSLKTRPVVADAPAATALRQVLDDHVVDGITLEEAAGLLGRSPAHLARAFRQAYGLPPHRYVVGRRVDRARSLLLRGVPAAEAAAEAGFWDQAHLTRHFHRTVGTTPARFVGWA